MTELKSYHLGNISSFKISQRTFPASILLLQEDPAVLVLVVLHCETSGQRTAPIRQSIFLSLILLSVGVPEDILKVNAGLNPGQVARQIKKSTPTPTANLWLPIKFICVSLGSGKSEDLG